MCPVAPWDGDKHERRGEKEEGSGMVNGRLQNTGANIISVKGLDARIRWSL